MKLSIDTSDNKKTVVCLDDFCQEYVSENYRSQNLLIHIDELLKKQKKVLSDVSQIEVNLGPGSFTGLRIGAAVANTLGWVLKVPVNGKKIGQIVTPEY